MSAVFYIIGVFLLALGLGIIIGAACNEAVNDAWHGLRARLRRLARRFRKVPPLQEHKGHHQAGSVPTSLLSSEETVEHADAMHRASEEFLPPSPFDWMAAQPQDGPVFRTLASYMQAGRPVEIPETPDRPPWMITTSAMDAVPDVPATDEGTLAMYHGRHSRPVHGERCEADVLAAEAALPFPYDPDYDNCAGEPHGAERVFYKWYGMEQTACPRCWTNMFGADPDPASVRTVDVLAAELPAATGEGERLASLMQP